MNKIFLVVVVATAASITSGCAHTHKVDGLQEKSEIPAGVKVGIGSSEIKEGSIVNVLKTSCEESAGSGRRGGNRKVCRDNKVGEATVLKVLDHDSAIVKPEASLQMDESMKVEKK
jgi:hypothetical protein